MQVPPFFDAVPPVAMRDPLAETLGAADDGIIEYGYVDAVKLAGEPSVRMDGGAHAEALLFDLP